MVVKCILFYSSHENSLLRKGRWRRDFSSVRRTIRTLRKQILGRVLRDLQDTIWKEAEVERRPEWLRNRAQDQQRDGGAARESVHQADAKGA